MTLVSLAYGQSSVFSCAGSTTTGKTTRWKFIASALWQQITGRIEVLDDAVRVEIDLPWAMQLLRDTIARRVHGRGVGLLDRPPEA